MSDSTSREPEVEGQRKKFKQAEDAEAPSEDTSVQADESRDSSEPEVEGHKIYHISDERLKDEILLVGSALERLARIRTGS